MLSPIVIPLPETIVPVVIIPFAVKLMMLFTKFSDDAMIFPPMIESDIILLAMIFPPMIESDIKLPAMILPPLIFLEAK